MPTKAFPGTMFPTYSVAFASVCSISFQDPIQACRKLDSNTNGSDGFCLATSSCSCSNLQEPMVRLVGTGDSRFYGERGSGEITTRKLSRLVGGPHGDCFKVGVLACDARTERR